MTCDTSHGWVNPRSDGARAKCGGPAICSTCQTEKMHESMLTACFGPTVSLSNTGSPNLTKLLDARTAELADAIVSANWSTCNKDEKALLLAAATLLRVAAMHIDHLHDLPSLLASAPWRDKHAKSCRSAPVAGHAQTDAARDVLAERQRQIQAEGFCAERDDGYTNGDLADAGAQYALAAGGWSSLNVWPWKPSTFKEGTPREMLIKASALILAEIERLDRAAIAAQQKGEPA